MGSIDGEKKKFKNAEDSEDDCEILEESPCGRWLKRREVVQQRDVPGIDEAYLAMDTEEGVEVVWNEVCFSERKNLKAQEDKISQVFDNLIKLEHPNIVKFHKYWIDSREDKPRVIFITEYMSSGSLKQFLKRTKRNVKKPPLQAWKRWCTQILSALSFLHSSSPPIVHGNLTCDTIFIQHNGLLKIGSVAPDAIHQHVKTCREGMKNTHFIAPEYGNNITPAVDIYSFGVCALEMATLEIQGANGDPGSFVTEEQLQRTIEGLEVAVQNDFIRACLRKEPELRPTARGLLFHRALFEVSSLKLLAAHVVVHYSANISETICDKVVQRHFRPDVVVAEIRSFSGQLVQFRVADIPVAEKLEKFVEDVKYGIYPLMVLASDAIDTTSQRPISPDVNLPVVTESPVQEHTETETRRISSVVCDVKPKDEGSSYQMTLQLRMDDRMNRQLSSVITKDDRAIDLAEELVCFGFISEMDRDYIATYIRDTLNSCISEDVIGSYNHSDSNTCLKSECLSSSLSIAEDDCK